MWLAMAALPPFPINITLPDFDRTERRILAAALVPSSSERTSPCRVVIRVASNK
jgi:hypothetical protein